jgi:TonB family protein
MSMGAMKQLAIAVALLASAIPAAAQDDPLKTARDLYASAAYEQALTELTRLRGGAAVSAAGDVDAYRAFCLVALGRTAEAETVAESLLRKNPTLTIDQYPDASPRIAAIFTSVRNRVLPEVIRSEYKTARDLAGKNPAESDSHMTYARRLLDDAQKIGAWDDTLADLRMLVDGFLELSRARPVDPPVAAAKADAAAAPAASVPVEFRAGNVGVVPPVIVSQALPPVPAPLLDLVKRLRGTETLEVVIDERGRVDKVTVTQSVNSAYDRLIVAAAREWKYKPATKDGRPVRFVKTVVIDANAQ